MRMNKIAKIATLVVVAAGLAAPAIAADGRMGRVPAKQVSPSFVLKAAQPTATGYPNGNRAEAWTAACYAEFGPNATNPDAGMLARCLSY